MPGFNRRNFLKSFAAGATIAPLIGGAVPGLLSARIIEAPKLEAIETPKIVPVLPSEMNEYLRQSDLDITMFIREKKSGRTMRYDLPGRCTKILQPYMYIEAYDDLDGARRHEVVAELALQTKSSRIYQ